MSSLHSSGASNSVCGMIETCINNRKSSSNESAGKTQLKNADFSIFFAMCALRGENVFANLLFDGLFNVLVRGQGGDARNGI